MSYSKTYANVASNEILSPDGCKAIFNKVEALSSDGGGETIVGVRSRSSSTARWARSQMHMGYEATTVYLSIVRRVNGALGSSITTRVDDDGLREAVQAAEASLRETPELPEDIVDPLIEEPIAHPTLWSDATHALRADTRGDLVRKILEPAEAAGFWSAGTLEIAAEARSVMSSKGMFRYYPVTDVRCAVTVRNRKGTGSGWAAGHHYDLAKINLAEISKIAMDKCERSQNPVAVEPGRYTVILEPQAVADLFTPILEGGPDNESRGFMRMYAESGEGPFYKSPGQSRITEQVLDRRLSLSADPMDPEAGFIPFNFGGEPYRAVTWIDRGVLKELSYPRFYAVRVMGKPTPLANSLCYRLSGDGPTTSVEEMIKTTERGILVTRFSGIQVVDPQSVLLTGFTRDGLWLIEKGKITKAIKNFRFTESPLFVLNNLDAYSEPKRTFSPPNARMAPAVKVRDFSFTSLADAV